jgi:hypothetical protein
MNIVDPRPTPLQIIARRILSITANSASCERLFSAFGLVLTRLRSRLGVQTMADVAELRLHLRDEHRRSGIAKQNLRKRMLSTTPGEPTPIGPPVPDAQDDTPVASVQLEDTEDTHWHENNLEDIISGLQVRLDADVDVDAVSLGQIHCPIKQLFNFSNTTWMELQEKYCMRGLEEEMEVYDLVDLDAPSEPDAFAEFDSFEESIMI